MEIPGLALGYLSWLLGGCTACTESVGVHWDRFTPRSLMDNWCMPVVLGLLMGGDWFRCPLSFFGVGVAAVLRLAWVLGSKPGRYPRWLSLAWC